MQILLIESMKKLQTVNKRGVLHQYAGEYYNLDRPSNLDVVESYDSMLERISVK